ncbi:MAG: pyridoxamine 5'-phosphate oxidase family protein [Nitriliruptor sp.]
MASPLPVDLTPIDATECVELLGRAPYVRIGFVQDGAPMVLPINILVHDDAIYLRTATGSKLGSAAAGGQVAIEADEGDEDARIGWSVLAQGTASIVTDPALEETLFAQRFEPWALPDTTTFWVRVEVESIAGRRIVHA